MRRLEHASAAGTVRAQTVRVLLVGETRGDEPPIRLALSDDPLRNFEITTATTLGGGLELAQSLSFDAILLHLAAVNVSVLADIKALALALPRTPILLITDVHDDALEVQASEHGAQAIVLNGRNEPGVLSRGIRAAMARKRFETCSVEQAYFDPLTGLANRALFHDRLRQALARATRADKRVAGVFVDVDHFKSVNDNLGRKVGDELLRAIAGSVRRIVRQTDTVARMDGDEFAVLVEPLNELTDAVAISQKILGAVHDAIRRSLPQVQPSASVGVVLFPDHARNADSLLECADRAMFFAKRQGGNRIQLLDRIQSYGAGSVAVTSV